MKKKFFAVALAITMTVSTAPTALTNLTALTANAATLSGAWWTAWTEGYELKDRLEFNVDVKGGDAVWNNFATVFVNAKTTGTQAPADEVGASYKEYAVIRGDNWGWGGGDNKTSDGSDITYEGGIADLGDADFIATMKDCKVNVVITKSGNDVTMVSNITGANGKTATRTVKFTVDMSAGAYVFFVPDTAEITVTPVTVSTPEDPSKEPSTGEAPTKPSTGETPANSSTISGAWWTVWTEGYELKDKLEFNIDVKGGDAVWNSFGTVFINAKTTGTQAPADEVGASYKEYAVVRGDNWGWGGGDNKTADGTDITYEGGIADLGDEDFIATMKDCRVNLVITKNGNDVTMVSNITGANGKTATRTAKFTVNMSAGAYVFFVPDMAEITVTPVTVPTPEESTGANPSTGETQTKPSTGETPANSSTISGAWWTAWTEGYELKDKLEFNIDVKGGDAPWNNFATVFVNAKTTGTQVPADEVGASYKEYAVIRSDNWGWGGGDNKTADGTDITYEGGVADLGDADFIATMKDCKVNLVITKNGNDVTMVSNITGANGKTATRTVKFTVDMSAGSYVFFVPDTAEITVTPVTVSTPEDPADTSTGEKETTANNNDIDSSDFDITDADAENVQKGAVITGLTINITLKVTSIGKSSPNYQAIVKFVNEKLKDKKVAAADLSLMENDTEYSKQPDGKVKVTIPVFEKIKDAKWVQVYRYDDIKKDFITVDKVVEVKDGKFTFETDHFTPYLFASVDAPAAPETTTTGTTTTDTGSKPKTGDSAPIAVFAGMAAAGLVVFAVSKKRKSA